MPYRLVQALLLGLVTAACAGAGGSTGPTPNQAPDSIGNDPNGVPDHLRSVTSAWRTDFSRASIDLAELQVGIPALDPRDLITPIDEPMFSPVAESTWLDPDEPGVAVVIGDEARFYPLSILTRHEIVNDTYGDAAVVVTYCPLCNSAVAFDPELDGRRLRFGVSGLLRNSDLVMWDDATESLWQQITGEAIVGELTGRQLQTIPTRIVRWGDFAIDRPNGQAMSEDQGFGAAYGANPYVGYSSQDQPSGFFTGELDDRLPALERVVGVRAGDQTRAYPFSELAIARTVNDRVGGSAVVVLYGADTTADALDSFRVADGRGIGTGVAYLATVDGQELTFESLGEDRFSDAETGSVWTLLGEAIEGPLTGTRLEIVDHLNEFWFAFHAFHPDAEVWSAG